MDNGERTSSNKVSFVLCCFAVMVDLGAIIYAISARDLSVGIALLLVVVPSLGTVYRGLTGLKK